MKENQACWQGIKQDAQLPARRRKPRKSRGKGLRVTTGCMVCRNRHLKCDEGRPICGACAKSNRECRYSSDDHKGPVEDQHEKLPNNPKKQAISDGAAPPESDANEMNRPKRPRRDSDPPFEGSPDIRRIGFQKDPWLPIIATPEKDATSPNSDSSGSLHNLSNATSSWFGLLASDVSSANYNFASPLLSARQLTTSPYPNVSHKVSPSTFIVDTPNDGGTLPLATSTPAARLSTGEAYFRNPGTVPDREIVLMKHFINSVSTWLDLNDPRKHFSLTVPRLALHNQGLMKAILALSARDLTLKPPERSPTYQPDRSVAVEYYHDTLHYLQEALKDQTFFRSDELLCIILLLSTYELIDGDGAAWERHLKGAFGVQRSLEINGESGGLKQAVWWTWLRQDLWAAYRERRKILSFYVPTKTYSVMDEWDLAERAVYLCCQCVNFASEEEKGSGMTNPGMRLRRADDLTMQLDTWLQHLTPYFCRFPSSTTSEDGPFESIWIHPPAFGNSLQLYGFAQLLILTTLPPTEDPNEARHRDTAIRDAVDSICGIAMALSDDASSIMSSGCVFVAGLHTTDPAKRRAIMDLLGVHKSQTGFPVSDFREELRVHWSNSESQ